MSDKIVRILLRIFAFVVGLVVAFFRPEAVQAMLSIVGIIVGLGYFIMTRHETEKKGGNKKDDKSGWFLVIQMLLYFIIGGAIGSTIPIYMELYG